MYRDEAKDEGDIPKGVIKILINLFSFISVYMLIEDLSYPYSIEIRGVNKILESKADPHTYCFIILLEFKNSNFVMFFYKLQS